ncbi:MAG: hypothetical protein H0U21_08285 [Acidimicrobiia bacterium]|nr:hypothetical protein [Acidimicrobiia bacterium]
MAWRCDWPDGPHHWITAVYRRTSGTGCPVAGRRRRRAVR